MHTSAQWSRGGSHRPTSTGIREPSRARKAPVPSSVAAPLSQWKQLRQTVSIRQDAVEVEPTSQLGTVKSRIRISHLCPEDKQKVGKLIRQLMKVGNENVQLRKELDDVKVVLDQAIVDKDDLQKKLTQSLDMLKSYQARLHSMQTQCELDQGKLTAAATDIARYQQQAQEHAHTLQVLRLDHDDAMRKAARQWELQLDCLREEMLSERRQRLHLAEHLDTLQRNVENRERDQTSDDVSTLLNLSAADKMRDIVLEWKHRMDAALEPVLPVPTTSSHTQTDQVDTHTIGVQFGRSSFEYIANEDAGNKVASRPSWATKKTRSAETQASSKTTISQSPTAKCMLPLRTSLHDSEFYDLSLLDLVQAMEGVQVSVVAPSPPSSTWARNQLQQSLGPLTADDLTMRRPPVDLDLDAIWPFALP